MSVLYVRGARILMNTGYKSPDIDTHSLTSPSKSGCITTLRQIYKYGLLNLPSDRSDKHVEWLSNTIDE